MSFKAICPFCGKENSIEFTCEHRVGSKWGKEVIFYFQSELIEVKAEEVKDLNEKFIFP